MIDIQPLPRVENSVEALFCQLKFAHDSHDDILTVKLFSAYKPVWKSNVSQNIIRSVIRKFGRENRSSLYFDGSSEKEWTRVGFRVVRICLAGNQHVQTEVELWGKRINIIKHFKYISFIKEGANKRYCRLLSHWSQLTRRKNSFHWKNCIFEHYNKVKTRAYFWHIIFALCTFLELSP
jgi:hypothetical protein